MCVAVERSRTHWNEFTFL